MYAFSVFFVASGVCLSVGWMSNLCTENDIVECLPKLYMRAEIEDLKQSISAFLNCQSEGIDGGLSSTLLYQ